MKKILIILFILITLIPILTTSSFKSEDTNIIRHELRAGGGGGGGSGGGGGGGGSSPSHTHTNNSNRTGTSHPISTILTHITVMFAMFMGSIIFYNKILKSSINSKRYLKYLVKKKYLGNIKTSKIKLSKLST